MAHRPSTIASLHRPDDFTKTVPFVPREVFRLVVRLEAQKALDVNVVALEQRFRVPPGYANDESFNARGELKHSKNFVPGPGTYEVPEQWPERDVTATPTAPFLSRTTRGSLSPSRRVASPSSSSPTRQVNSPPDDTPSPDLLSATRTTKSPRARLRLPSPSDPPNLLTQIPNHQQNQLSDSTSDASTSVYSSLKPQNTSTFSMLGRGSEIGKERVPGVGSYEIKRLWDSITPRTNLGAPSPALFGASKGKRIVTWRPALTPASCAVSASWDSSHHYAKQKEKVVRYAAKRRLQSATLHARTLSAPQLGPSTVDAIVKSEPASVNPASVEAPEDDDPFSWLRQRPNGRRATETRQSITISNYDAHVAKLVRQHSNPVQDGDGSAQPLYTAKPKDVRIKVSCRMPGGMLISVSVYSLRKLGHFKSAFLLRQKRFQSVDEFDLYHTSGRKLTGLDDTLVSCGVHDRSTLQVVPATVALSSQAANHASNTK